MPRSSNPIYVTAAHIDEREYRGYTLIYKDTLKDVAYYINESYEYYLPPVNSFVVIDNTLCKVVGHKDNEGFYVTCKSSIYQGLSGMRVRSLRGHDIGFVSSYISGKLYCVSIK